MARIFNSMSRMFFGDSRSTTNSFVPSISPIDDTISKGYLLKNSRDDVLNNLLGFENERTKNSTNVKRTRSMVHNTASGLYISKSKKDCRKDQPKRPIFGAPLKHLELSKNKYPNVPRFVVDCVQYIERNYINNDGIYRVSGKSLSVASLRHDLTNDYNIKLFKTAEANTLTSLLKLFFREMNESLIPKDVCKMYLSKVNNTEFIENLCTLCSNLREPNRSTLCFLIKHLARVAAHSTENRMTAYNLATVWGPSILWVDEISDIRITVEIVKLFIQNYAQIIKEERIRFR